MTPLQSGDLYPFLSNAFDHATSRIWAVIFLVDVRIHNDPDLSVRSLLQKLDYARWRNVDVRVVVSPADTEDIHVGNHTSALYLESLGVETRMFGSEHQSSTHSKYVVVDARLAVVGSHNWTHHAFHQAVESSVAIASTGLVKALEVEFAAVWENSTRIRNDEF